MKTAIISLAIFLTGSLALNFYQACVRGDERLEYARFGYAVGYEVGGNYVKDAFVRAKLRAEREPEVDLNDKPQFAR